MGYLHAFLAFAFIGTYLIPIRFTKAKGEDFLGLMGLGLLACAVLMAPYLKDLARHPLWIAAGLLSGLIWAVAQALANRAVGEVSFAKAVVVFNLNSFVNMAVGLALFKEATGLKAILVLLAGGILLFIGAALVSSAQATQSTERNLKKGLLLAAVAGLLWGVYFVPLKYIQQFDPDPSLGAFHLLAGLLVGGGLTAVLLGRRSFRPPLLNRRDVAWACLSGFLWTGGTAFFLLAIARLGLARAVPLINTNTLMYAGWSLFVFKELPSSQAKRVLWGVLIVLAGAGLFALV